MRSARFLLLLAIGYWLSAIFLSPKPAFAQIPAATSTTSTSNSFTAPNMDPDVPRNQHTFAQATTIEVLSAVHCILTGIDPIDPLQGCLGINPESRRLGISKPAVDAYGRPEVTGLVGTATGFITSTYQPIASTGTYVSYISDRFGIVQKAHAAHGQCHPETSGDGFCGLQPILRLWETSRNIAYALLTIAFIFIGVGVMLRVKIDPRTVMTIQNQIPKIIISIILITFSYAISALLVDLMWVTTYAGSYLITADHDPFVGNCTDRKNKETLSGKATTTILQTPITYFNQIFARCSDETNPGVNENDRDGGFHVLTTDVANNFGNVIGNVARSLLFDKDDLETDCKWYRPIKCAKKAAVNFIGTLISTVAMLIIFVILVITLFKIWFNLLKAFIYTLVYIILGPVIIVFGLLPTKPMGFEAWIRRLFVNIAVFPLTAFLFVAARLLMDLYDNQSPDQFIPPLVGNPIDTNFGALMAFGVLLIAPTIQTILREKMGVKNIGTPGIVGAGIAAGAAVIGAPVNRAMKHLNRSDHRTGEYGMLARLKQETGKGAIGLGGKIPGFKGMSEKAIRRRQNLEDYGDVRGRGETREGAAGTRGAGTGGAGGGAGSTGAEKTRNPFKAIRNRYRRRRGRGPDDDDNGGSGTTGGGTAPTPSGYGPGSTPRMPTGRRGPGPIGT